MAYKSVRLGDYIEQVDSRNRDNTYSIKDLRGVDKNKNFIPTVASTSGLELSNYKVIQTEQFVYSGMQTGRDKCIRVSLNTGSAVLVSPAYTVFKVKDKGEILPEYLMMFFSNPEIDRIGWYKSDSSVRANLDWDRFCEIDVPLPPPEKQREYVATYGNLLKLSDNHEKSFADLQLITNTFTEKLVEKYGTKSLGDYIQITDTRNSKDTLGKQDLRGISTSKAFIQSKANTTGVSFTNYKVVQPGQFAYVADTSRRGDKIALAYNDEKPYIISSIYTTFEISDTEALLPEFLLLWFMRPEFDRYARYNSWGSARETFDWSEMQRVKLPIPSPSVQRSIVAIYHALETRKRLAARLKSISKEISPVLIKDAKDKVGVAL